MNYAALLVLLIATWALVHIAAAHQRAVEATRTSRQPGGVSILPGMVLMPALFLGFAWLIDRWHSSAGTLFVGAAHTVLLVVASVSVARSRTAKSSS